MSKSTITASVNALVEMATKIINEYMSGEIKAENAFVAITTLICIFAEDVKEDLKSL